MLTTEKKIQILEDWIDALLSGEYQQTKGTLQYIANDGKPYYCCLGVLGERQWGKEIPLRSFQAEGNKEIYVRIAELFGKPFSHECAQKNDDGFTFEEIVETTIRPYLEKMKDCLSS